MNNYKFAFIICTNHNSYLHECLHYINQLIVPSGYEIDILTIHDAHSMTSGYNEGMQSSDAKYKIYMHQDTFIINKHFLQNILDIFHSDSSIGMIGMFGYSQVSLTGCMWDTPSVNESFPISEPNPENRLNYHYSLSAGIRDVAMIDGFMMITSYDLTWNEDLLKDWDFYDAFQCMNFLLHGYRIVVPVQTLPWCIHDDGLFLSLWNYEKYRKLFVTTYEKYLGKSWRDIVDFKLT